MAKKMSPAVRRRYGEALAAVHRLGGTLANASRKDFDLEYVIAKDAVFDLVEAAGFEAPEFRTAPCRRGHVTRKQERKGKWPATK